MDDKHTEVKNQVVISVEDCKNVREYGKHFGVEIPAVLKAVFDAFIADPRCENQNAVKLQMCKWILTNKHPSFKDKLWEESRKLAEEATFNLQFDEDLKDTLARDEEEGNHLLDPTDRAKENPEMAKILSEVDERAQKILDGKEDELED